LRFKTLHEWPTDEKKALGIQIKFNVKVITERTIQEPTTIAAVDTAFDNKTDYLYASAVIFEFPDLTEIESAQAKLKANFPYVPGQLAFREGPVILKALEKLDQTPDVIIFRGHGIAHPHFFGLASHLGVWTGIPSIGCALEPLAGDFDMPGLKKGSKSAIYYKGFEVGYVYRSRTDVKPVFISPGHMCIPSHAVDVISRCVTSYRIPEPLRRAHLYANRYKQQNESRLAVPSRSA
jgi:deoxyribonuclease V